VVLLACIGCHRAPTVTSFHRFVEHSAPANRWYETKVQIGQETRNVLFAPYRSHPREIEVAADGTIALGEVAEFDKINSDVSGITIKVQPLPLEPQSSAEDAATRIYIPLRLARDRAELAARTVKVSPEVAPRTRIQTSVRAVHTLPREYVTRAICIPTGALLDFGMGFEGEPPTTQPVAVRFSVQAAQGQERTVLFSQTLRAQSEGDCGRWIDESIDLSELAGSTARFVFSTDTVNHKQEADSANAGVPLHTWSTVWSSPILYIAEPDRTDKMPNFILISLDTLRADHLGCYGYHRETSPRIDSFARGAFLFENCIAPTSWTLPSHTSVFTGLHPAAQGPRDVLPAFRPVEQRETTLGEAARQSGYLTAAYTEGAWVRGALGFAQGFELYSDGKSDITGDAENTFHHGLTWIRKFRQQPFFLFVHTYQTHQPYRPPARFATMFDSHYTGPPDDDIVYPKENRSEPYKERIEALYDAEIAYTDDLLGTFLEQLSQMELLENTTVIIFSDHGEEFLEHGDFSHGNTLYDEVLQVPLIIRVAGGNPPAGRVTRHVSLTDLYATVLEMLQFEHNAPATCLSLLPLIQPSKIQRSYDKNTIIGELYVDPQARGRNEPGWWLHSVRTEDWKYIFSAEKGTEELYSLRNDPAEKNNIAAQNQAQVEHYRKSLQLFLRTVAAERTPSPAAEHRIVPLTEHDRRQLKALGYM
jgi:arylsulfatase A-like enzyme